MTQNNGVPTDKFLLEPVAIIGLSCLFPGAETLAAYWAAIKKGRDAIGDIPVDHWSVADYYDPNPKAQDKTYGRRGGFLAPVDFEPLKYGIVPNDLAAIDTTQLLGLITADRALNDAGYPAENGFNHSRTAVILGVTGALKMVVSLGSRLAHPQLRKALADSGIDPETAQDVLARFAAEFSPWQENSFPGLLGNVTAGRIAGRLNLGGANMVVDAACASSLGAIRQAILELNSRQADLVLTGGMDTFSDPFMYTCFAKTPALSPTGEVRAYDKDGDGTILGEGLGVVVLKRLADAKAAGDRIYAVIRSLGAASDGKGAAIFAPKAEGQVKAINSAYGNVDFTPDSVELLEGHGTGTAVGDAVEVEALTQVFSQANRAKQGQPWCALGSVKSQIGHTKAAAGVAGLIKAALALYFKALPPTIKVKAPLPSLVAPESPFFLATTLRPWLTSGELRRAGVSAFGFGGSNFHCLLEEAESTKAFSEAPVDFKLFAFSAASNSELASRLKAASSLAPSIVSKESIQSFSASDNSRLIFLAADDFFATMALELSDALADVSVAGTEIKPDLPNVFFGQGTMTPPRIGLLGVSPSAVRSGMFCALALDWPEMLAALNGASQKIASLRPELSPLSAMLYPPDLASASALAQWADDFQDSEVRQIVAEAFNSALGEMLRKFKVEPAVTLEITDASQLVSSLAARPEIDFWVEVGSSMGLSFLAKDNGYQCLVLDEQPNNHLAFASLLGRLAASGVPVDFSAWPVSELLSQEPERKETFSVKVTGANQVTKTLIPPVPAKVPSVSVNVSAEASAPSPAPSVAPAHAPLLNALANMTKESARLQKEFFAQQTAALELIQSGLHFFGLPSENSTPSVLANIPELKAPATDASVSAELVAPAILPAAPQVKTGPPIIFKIISDETGYPLEMLTPEMDLEGDLGLDSIKKVEIMALFNEKVPGLNQLNSMDLVAQAQTLGDLIAAENSVENFTPLGADPGLNGSEVSGLAVDFSDEFGDFSSVLAPPQNLTGGLAKLSTNVTMSESGNSSFQPELIIQDNSSDDLWASLCGVVCAETGYPLETLRPELGLSDDLGLDSIKMVEIASALAEKFPQAEIIAAGDLSQVETLGDLLNIWTKAVNAAPQATTQLVLPSAPEQLDLSVIGETQTPTSKDASTAELILELVSRETGYPADMLNLAMSLEGDLGLDSIKKVEIMATLSEQFPQFESLGQASALADLETLADLVSLVGAVEPPSPQPLSPSPSPLIAQHSEPIQKPLEPMNVRSEHQSVDSVIDVLLDVVAAETGYPKELLNMSATLEGDLGLDSIKRVEIMAALSEKLGDEALSSAAPELLSHSLTLEDLSKLLVEMAGGAKGSGGAAYASLGSQSQQNAPANFKSASVESLSSDKMTSNPVAASIKTTASPLAGRTKPAIQQSEIDQGFAATKEAEPADLSEPQMTTAVSTFRIKMQSVAARPTASPTVDLSPRAAVALLTENNPLATALANHFSAKGLTVEQIPFDQSETLVQRTDWEALIIIWPGESCDASKAFAAFKAVQGVGHIFEEALREGKSPLLMALSFMGGNFGIFGTSAQLGAGAGAVNGLLKSVAREWPLVRVRTVDLPLAALGSKADFYLPKVLNATTLGTPVELGISASGRAQKPHLEPFKMRNVRVRHIREGQAILVTGGARGVTAAALLELAHYWHPHLLILGRTPLPSKEPSWLASLKDEASIKQTLFKRAQKNGEQLSPIQLAKQCAQIMAGREVASNLAALEKAGAKTTYLAGDFLDKDNLRAAIEKLISRHGPIYGFIHGAGVLADSLLLDKKDESFQSVFNTKVQMAQTILEVLKDEPLNLLAFFSSSTARFGRKGQSDYGAANEFLNKIAQSHFQGLEGPKSISINWGPWEGGMVDEGLKRLFAKEGVGVIPMTEGARLFASLVASPKSDPVEIVVLGPETDLTTL